MERFIVRKPANLLGPNGEAMHLVDVSGIGNSCLVHCFLVFCVGSEDARHAGRILAAAQLMHTALSTPGLSLDIVRFSHYAKDVANAMGGKMLGEHALKALSDALRINVRYSEATAASSVDAQYWMENNVVAARSSDVLHIYNTGSLHFVLAKPHGALMQPICGTSADSRRAFTMEMYTLASQLLADVASGALGMHKEFQASAVLLQTQIRDALSSLSTEAGSVLDTDTVPSTTAAGLGDEAAAVRITSPVTGKRRRHGTPTGICKWQTLVECNAHLQEGYRLMAQDEEAKSLHSAHGHVRCVRCNNTVAAETFSLKQHVGIHIEEDKALLKKPPTAVQHSLLVQRSSTQKITATEATAAMLLHSMGASYSFIENVSAVLPLLHLVSRLPAHATLSHADGPIDEEIRVMREAIRTMIADKPGVLVFDGGITRFNRGSDVLAMLFDSPLLTQPVLLRVVDMKKQKKDAAYLAQQLEDVIGSYGLNKINIVGVASDTTAVMPAAIKRAGLEHIPCWAHVCNLLIKELYNALGVNDVMQWRAYLTSKHRLDTLEARGLHPRALRVPSHRFAYWEAGLRELLPDADSPNVWTKWDTYTASLDEATPAVAKRRRKHAERSPASASDSESVPTAAPERQRRKRAKRSTTHASDSQRARTDASLPRRRKLARSTAPVSESDEAPTDDDYAISISKAAARLKKVMPTADAKVRAWLALQLTTMGADVIRLAEHNARMIPASTDTKLRAWLSFLENTHAGSNTRGFIAGNLKLINVQLSAEELDQVENDVTLGLENALAKIAVHLQEPGQALTRTTNEPAPLQLLPSFRRRALFAVKDMSTFRFPVDTATRAFMLNVPVINNDLAAELEIVNDSIAAWCTEPTYSALRYDTIGFWQQVHLDSRAPRVAAAALRALAVVMSNTAAERSFSTLRNLEVPNRLHGGARYVENMLMASYNRMVYMRARQPLLAKSLGSSLASEAMISALGRSHRRTRELSDARRDARVAATSSESESETDSSTTASGGHGFLDSDSD